MTGKPAQPNQSLIDGLACLEVVALSGRAIGVSEIAGMLDLETTRVSRLLGTLAYLGLTQKTPSRKYDTGPGIHVLSAMGLRGSNILNAALPVVRNLRETHALDLAIGVLWRRHVCYLYHGASNRPVEQAIGGHGLVPAEESSIGRIMLASLSKSDRKALYANLPNFDLSALEDDLLKSKRLSYGIAANGGSIAVAIGKKPVAGLACFDLANHDRDELLAILRKASDEITQSITNDSGSRS